MKKRRTVILGVIALVCIGIFLGQGLFERWKVHKMSIPSSDIVLGVRLAENDDFLQDKEKKIPAENTLIAFEKILLPYDKVHNMLYLSQSLQGWTGTLSVKSDETYVLCAPLDSYWTKEQDAIKEGHVFTLWAVGEKDYYEFQLVISGMPVISMNTERMEVQEKVDYEVDPDKLLYGSEDLYYGTVSVFNPDVGTDSYEMLESNLCYHIRGNSSQVFEKKGYSLKLQDYKGKNIDVSLLGMRADNSWKLNALNTDASRIREISAAQMWQQIDEADTNIKEPGPVMEYVELVLDGDYRGLYCLVEPVDEKKLELDENDVLYKLIEQSDIPEDSDIQQSIDQGWKIQYPYRIRYPEEITDYESAWYPIRDYLNIFYRTPEIDYETSISKVNLDNLVDYFIFTMAASACDNIYKNIFYVARLDKDGSYEMHLVPWDLDYTFGNQWDGTAFNIVFFDENYMHVYAEGALPQLKRADAEKVGEVLLNRWKEYRTDFLSTEAVLGLLQKNRTYIIETGAVNREVKRWPESGVDMNIDAMITYQTSRLEWIDEFFEKWITE